LLRQSTIARALLAAPIDRRSIPCAGYTRCASRDHRRHVTGRSKQRPYGRPYAIAASSSITRTAPDSCFGNNVSRTVERVHNFHTLALIWSNTGCTVSSNRRAPPLNSGINQKHHPVICRESSTAAHPVSHHAGNRRHHPRPPAMSSLAAPLGRSLDTYHASPLDITQLLVSPHPQESKMPPRMDHHTP